MKQKKKRHDAKKTKQKDKTKNKKWCVIKFDGLQHLQICHK